MAQFFALHGCWGRLPIGYFNYSEVLLISTELLYESTDNV